MSGVKSVISSDLTRKTEPRTEEAQDLDNNDPRDSLNYARSFRGGDDDPSDFDSWIPRDTSTGRGLGSVLLNATKKTVLMLLSGIFVGGVSSAINAAQGYIRVETEVTPETKDE